MALSIFDDKSKFPSESDLESVLASSHECWKDIIEFVFKNRPKTEAVWSFSGAKYGWSLRLKEKKRAIVYLIPCNSFFKFGIVFGAKATVYCRTSDISKTIMEQIEEAPVYAEGRGIRLDIKDTSFMEDLKKLILIKFKF